MEIKERDWFSHLHQLKWSDHYEWKPEAFSRGKNEIVSTENIWRNVGWWHEVAVSQSSLDLMGRGTSGDIIRDPRDLGTNQRKRMWPQGGSSTTSLTEHFEHRFAWGSSSKQESIQRPQPWAASQGKMGKGAPEEKRGLGGVAQQHKASVRQKALKGSCDGFFMPSAILSVATDVGNSFLGNEKQAGSKWLKICLFGRCLK